MGDKCKLLSKYLKPTSLNDDFSTHQIHKYNSANLLVIMDFEKVIEL